MLGDLYRWCGRFLTTGESLPLMSPQLPWVGWYCHLSVVVCHSCWLPAEKFQPANGSTAFHCSFGCLCCFLFNSALYKVGLMRFGELCSHRLQSSICLEGIHMMECCLVPCRDCNTTITTSVPCSLQHDTSHRGFSGPESCLLSKDVTCPPWWGGLGLNFEGDADIKMWIVLMWVSSVIHTECSSWVVVFRRSWVQISAQRLAILTEAFHGFP
jgi:hypothetical protein